MQWYFSLSQCSLVLGIKFSCINSPNTYLPTFLGNFGKIWFTIYSNIYYNKSSHSILFCIDVFASSFFPFTQAKVANQKYYQIEIVELWRLFAFDVVPPIANAMLLVEDGALGTQE